MKSLMKDFGWMLSMPWAIGVVIQTLVCIVFFYRLKRHQGSVFEQSIDNHYEMFYLRMSEQFVKGQLANQDQIRVTIQQQMADVREQIQQSFSQHTMGLTAHVHSLTNTIHSQLNTLNEQVNLSLVKGFETTSTTFIDIVARLSKIDEAQKKISELSTHMVSLQDILLDKKARGAFGEVQLQSLIANMMPATHYKFQYTLSNKKRADCILFLPKPTGHVVVDAKFPLESYQKMHQSDVSVADKKVFQQQFKQDVQKHIKDIAEKYIILNETADGAVMFIPAEAIFSEIHANYPDVISLAQRLNVWLVSPTTLMAVLTTARAVLKDDATRKQVHVIQSHLHALATDFQRFEQRMDKLSRHMDLAHQDVSDISTSAKKISQRFQKIESVDLLVQEEN